MTADGTGPGVAAQTGEGGESFHKKAVRRFTRNALAAAAEAAHARDLAAVTPEVESEAKRLWNAAYHPAMADDREWSQVDGPMRWTYLGRAAHNLLIGRDANAELTATLAALRERAEVAEAKVAAVWDEAVQAVAWAQDNAGPEPLRYVAEHNPYRAALADRPTPPGRSGTADPEART